MKITEIIKRFEKFGVTCIEVPGTYNKVSYKVSYEKYATGLQMIGVLKYHGFTIKNRQKGKFIVA